MANTFKALLSLCAVATFLTLTAACSREGGKPVEPVALEEVPQTIERGFAGAAAPVKQAATDAANALQQNNPGRAFATLQELSTRSDITPEQREAATRSLMAVNKKLSEAAERGDKQAQQILDLHRSRK